MAVNTSITGNPFYQPARQWQIHVLVDRSAVGIVEEAFVDGVLAVSSFEINEERGEWCVDIITDAPPETLGIDERLALVSGLHNIATPRYETKALEAKDWVGEVERNFPPINVGRFYIYGTHVQVSPPKGKIALQVNAGLAFGSGEHATTSGCLIALGHLAKRRRFIRPLDMGCGSGILAIAMAKLWHCPVVGVDIDPVSIAVAGINARRNRVRALMGFSVSNGYSSQLVRTAAPFDIIVANILARPLVKMAPLLTESLAPGGIAVLSGLLASQERQVLAAHRAQGLRLISRIRREGWNTLVIG